jgi:hypothetical protein
MLDQSTRAAILKLRQHGHSIRGIARALKLSRGAVREVLRSGTEVVPTLVREEKATPYRDQILELYARCKGNLVRVHEELIASGAQFSYPALTAFCRRQGIGQEPKVPVGEYHFRPAQEMQHDTSPHRAEIGGQLRPVQTASLVCCYSRLLFFEFLPTFTRFDCKVFLTDALQYLQGACDSCLIDNTHVVVLKGTGRDMVPVPEMAAFAERYGLHFQAHEPHLKPLPIWVPPVYLLHQRLVDVEGYVSVDTNRYSVPDDLIGRHVEVRQTKDGVEISRGPRLVATHTRILEPTGRKYRLPEHRHQRGQPSPRSDFCPEEKLLLAKLPEAAGYIEALKKRYPGRVTLPLRRLLRLVDDYPRAPLLEVLQTATQYGLFDLERVESMVLRKLARDYFQIKPDPDDGDDEG